MRNQALDVLRGIAILLVMGHHFVLCWIAYQVGWSGVDLFFVLSGFLISGLLFDEFLKRGSIDIKRFWIRRAFKIYPAFYVLIGLTSLALLAVHQFSLTKTLDELIFMQAYLPHVWGHTWSLSIEEHFYFGLPVLLFALMLINRRKSNPFSVIPWLFGVLAVTCLLLRARAQISGLPAPEIHIETHLRIDSLFAGVLLSYFYRFHRERFNSVTSRPIWLLAVPFLAPAAFMPMDGRFMNTIGLSFMYVGYGLILAWAVKRPASVRRVPRLLAALGRYSYSIYIWHIPIREAMYRGHVGVGFFLAGSAVSIVAGVAMAMLIEIPSLALRDRLFPRFGRPERQAEPQTALVISV